MRVSQELVDHLAVSQIPDRVRQLVVEWPEDAPRGAIAAFCRVHGVSRSWFHVVRARSVAEGEGALVKASTRPHSSPSAVSAVVVAVVIATRHQLTGQGKDHGPRSILDVLYRSGFTPLPSRSTIARILDREQLVERNKRKRPKRSHMRIRSQFPNQRWQSDGLEVALSTGEVVVVIEILDDCTRYNIVLHAGPAESAMVVTEAFRLAIQAHGRPVLVHTDNGAAFNRSRYGAITQLQGFLGDLGVKMITGRPRHPKSQGKVERAHRTLLNFIDAHAPATTDQLRLVLQQYRHWYNHDRSHQALPAWTAPADLYQTLPKVAPPGDPIIPPGPHATTTQIPVKRERFSAIIQQRAASWRGTISYRNHKFQLGQAWADQVVTILHHEDHIEMFDSAGALFITLAWPPALHTTGIARQIRTTPPGTQMSTKS